MLMGSKPEVCLVIARACVIALCLALVTLRRAHGAPASKPASVVDVPAAVSALSSRDALERQTAESNLVAAGAAAVPALVDELAAGRRQSRMRVLIANIGPAAIPPLVELIDDADAGRRGAARSVLSQVRWRGSGAHAALLIGCLRRQETRHPCGMALVRTMDAKAGRWTPELLALLKDGEPEVRTYAAIALGEVGSAAGSAIQPLARALSDPAAPVRGAAATALGKMGRKAVPAREALKAAVDDQDAEVRLAVQEALRRVK